MCRYLQSSTMDVMSARNMAEATVKALQVCRNDQRFHTIWQMADIKSNTIKNVIKDTKFSIKEETLPRFRHPTKCFQVLVRELCEGHTPHDSHQSPSSIGPCYWGNQRTIRCRRPGYYLCPW